MNFKETRNKITIQRKHLADIKDFIDSFPESEYFILESDNSSGIGQILKASVVTSVYGHSPVLVTKDIVDESDW